MDVKNLDLKIAFIEKLYYPGSLCETSGKTTARFSCKKKSEQIAHW